MKSFWKLAVGIAAAASFTLLVPDGARASVASSAVDNCNAHSGSYTLTITISWVQNPPPGQSQVSVSPATNKDGTCVQWNDTITFTLDSSVPAASVWSAVFPQPNAQGIFKDACTFGNTQNTSCTVNGQAPAHTYSYSVTVKGVTLDPKVIIQNSNLGGKHHHRKAKKSASSTP